MLNLNQKKIYISPHTPKSTMLEKKLKENFDIEILGFIDKQKEGSNIFKLEDIINTQFDYIFIYSPNHFHFIYDNYRQKINSEKLIQVEILNNQYVLNTNHNIFMNKLKKIPFLIKLELFKYFVKAVDYFNIKRNSIVFISKDFIGTNNKVLFLETVKQIPKTYLLSNNKKQLSSIGLLTNHCLFLGNILSYFQLAMAKVIIQDQGNSNYLLKYLSPNQKKIQLWHGIPLKRMNRLVDISYDYHISTSNFVNETSLSDVIPAKIHLDFGYPRNDLLLKNHTKEDLLFVDNNLYHLAKENKIIVYMPTHRESEPNFGNNVTKKLPLNLDTLNNFMKKKNAIFILKLHPFVSKLYENQEFSHIFFYESQNDIYPILKYTDILITDYSSVYFDFLLVNKPIVFFDYDYEEYSSNMSGFVYEYEENTPGEKVETQIDLEKCLEEILNGKDSFKKQRQIILDKFFTYKDEFATTKILTLLKE